MKTTRIDEKLQNEISTNKSRRIAIMGGTFDPIHYGHLSAAEAVRVKLQMEKIIFIPAGKPPHKPAIETSSNEHRYIMTALATLSNPYFEASRIEIERPGTTYTVDTLKELHVQYGKGVDLFFIIGADNISEILNWKSTNELFKLTSFIAVTRPGHNIKKQKLEICSISKNYNARIYHLEIAAYDISSTVIRNNIQANGSIKYMLPDEVERYIYKNQLYKNITERNNDVGDVNEIKKRVKSMLSKKRFTHTEGVANEASRLAAEYNIDTRKAYLAGLLHDCAKEMNENEMNRLIMNYDIKLDNFTKKSMELAHGIIGAKVAEAVFMISEHDILNAIKYHTTGRAEMSDLEKILFLADIIEPNREPYPEYKKIKEMAYIDLDKALYLGLKMKNRYMTEGNKSVHPLTNEAIEYYSASR